MCSDDGVNDLAGSVQSDIRHTGIQQMNQRFQGPSLSAAKYADLCS